MKKRRAKIRLRIFFAVVGLALLLLILLYAPFFNVSSIEVIGNARYTSEEIKAASGIKTGENAYRKLSLKWDAILEFRLLDSEESVKSLPYVRTCTVRIIFPNMIRIEITEREPAAYIRNLDTYLTVDREGYVLESTHENPPQDLKEIRGVEFSKYVLGGQLEASEIELVTTGADILAAINNSDNYTEFKLMQVLDWIDLVSRNDALLSLDKRIIVRFDPTIDLQYTIDFTKEIFFKKIGSNETGRLEFSGEQNPSFIPH